MRTPLTYDLLGRAREPSTLPPVSTARSTMTLPGFMPATMSSVTMRGALRPKTWAVVMTMSALAQCLAIASRCLCELLLGQFLGVAVLGLPGFAEVDLDEPGPQRLDLLLDHGPGVEGLDPGAQALGGGDGLQAGHAGADDEDPGRGDRAGRGHHHGQDLVQPLGGQDHRHVAGQVGLRTERVHLLGERGARNHLHADRADPGLGQGLDQLRLAERVQVADVNAAVLHGAGLGHGGLVESQHHVGGAERTQPVHDYRCAGLLVGGIGEMERSAETGLHLDLRAGLDQFFHGSGDDRDPLLAGFQFPWDK